MFSNTEDGAVKESIINIVKPFILEGILTNNWDNYYDAIYNEINDLFGKSKLDNNGEPSNGTNIEQWTLDYNASCMVNHYHNADGTYSKEYYRFYYDWRLDPLETADKLNEFIQGVKAVTGFDKVCVLCHCLGSNIFLAYLSKYGYDDIYGVGIGASVAMGSEPLGETLAGGFEVDGYAIRRLLVDCEKYDVFDSLSDEVNTIIDFAVDCGLIEAVTDSVRYTIYSKIEAGVTSALALSTFFTWPGYWAAVGSDYYDEAMLNVFGEEGSEKRTEYAGLIEKIENYHNQVAVNIPELMLALGDNGVNVGIVCKYGSQLIPVCESQNEIADQFSTVERSSFGATAAPSIFETFTEDYIAAKKAQGLDKYISPDKQIDASTCLYPDSTFFIKNARHSTFSDDEDSILMTIMGADRQLTVDDFELSQFAVASNPDGDHSAVKLTKMTEENCHTESWYEQDGNGDPSTSFISRIATAIKSLIAFLKLIFERIFNR